ncbi:tocopherol cyclase family protein [Anaerolentibacter hominis]|uniref:tocopherol cyclase family protein n=1 Tax=Anaerolentibacter hominis TaxID=3079009 RepID=UPI0031B857A0
MKYYQGNKRTGCYFEGWYLKHQACGYTLALIPSIHIDEQGRKSANLQVITDQFAEAIPFPHASFHASENQFQVLMGKNRFGADGISLDIQTPELNVTGVLRYGPFTPLSYDIMGPFGKLPGMECKHGILSLCHTLTGTLVINGTAYCFDGGTGYIEKDWGSSFPSSYLWTQCNWDTFVTNSIMLSVARIPLGRVSFTGCICSILYNGVQYRLATYLGARILAAGRQEAVICQGSSLLQIQVPPGKGHLLQAPVRGTMGRMIRENPSGPVTYRFFHKGHLLFDETLPYASFEYVPGRK